MTTNFKYVGVISFTDSPTKENDSRVTNVMSFRVASDWLQSVEEFYRPMVAAGDYDGSEIMISVFYYAGDKPEFVSLDEDEYSFMETDSLVQDVRIRNPFYVNRFAAIRETMTRLGDDAYLD